MSSIDAILWRSLASDILRAEAEQRLPLPPRVPSTERETVRPARRAPASTS